MKLRQMGMLALLVAYNGVVGMVAGAQAATLTPTANFFPYAGNEPTGSAGNGVVAVTAASATSWSARSNVSWLTIVTGANGTGNGSVAFSVAANSGAPRVGTLTIAGQTFTVTQLGAPPATGGVPIIEYHNSAQDDYFITADPAEQAQLDAAALAGAVWSRTGTGFSSGGNASVYRFIYDSPSGVNTHFYTVNTNEQSGLLANYPIWALESPYAFYMTAANSNQTCPAETVPVYRAANEQTGSHRFSAIQNAISEVLARGWTNEGVAFCAPAAPQVVTESGPLIGIATGQINEYLGVPYAAPPVGARRWIPPQSFGSWSGVFSATKFGSQCPQASGGNENCLFLNVYTPTVQPAGNPNGLAVMVWIHGGALINGAGSEFDPTPLMAQGGVMVVTFNYRLALLGFLAHPALDSEGHLAGNYGFMDQQAALGWVKRNIAAFGGDPNRVTVFGESAGGLSVYSQLASPLAAGLFQRAIAQSGAYASFVDYLDRIIPIAVAETTSRPAVDSGIAVASALGCGSQTAACLRGVTAAALVAQKPRAIFPFIDGTLLTQTLLASFSSGTFNQVPVITGTTHDEYRYFVANNFNLNPSVGPLANADYVSAIDTLYYSLTPTELNSVLANYPLPPNPPANAASLALAAAGTDGNFVCTARHAMQALSGHVTTYAYEFNDENAPPPTDFPVLPFPLGAYHSSDVQYLFNRSGIPSPFTADQKQLSRAMTAYWTQFAKTGDPNSAGQPPWTPYNAATDLRLSLVPPIPVSVSTFAADHKCALWDSF